MQNHVQEANFGNQYNPGTVDLDTTFQATAGWLITKCEKHESFHLALKGPQVLMEFLAQC